MPSLPLTAARALLDPLDGVAAAVHARRWAWPLVLLCLSVAASGVAFALRWNPEPAVLREMQSTGQLQRMTEAQLQEEIQTTSRRALVGGVARGALLPPLFTLALASALWLVAWLLERPARFSLCLATAAVGLLPLALFHFIWAGSALYQHALSEAQAARLVPSHLGLLPGLGPRSQRVLAQLDFFRLWSVLLLGLGLAAASGLRRARALAAALLLYALYAGVFELGLPGLLGRSGGPPW